MAIAVIGIIVLPVGIASVILGFVYQDSPCILCRMERIVMIFIGLLGLLVLRYGAKRFYLGLLIISATVGILLAMRHTSFHIMEDVGSGFSIKIFGIHTYAWAVLVFWIVLIVSGIILIFFKDTNSTKKMELNAFSKTAFYVFFVIVGINAVQAFISSGPPPFVALGDPVRMSSSPSNWTWSMQHWAFKIKTRPSIDSPMLVKHDGDSKSAPINYSKMLKSNGNMMVEFKTKEPLIGIDYKDGTYALLDSSWTIYSSKNLKDEEHVRVDDLYSIDLSNPVAVTLVNGSISAIANNKSYMTVIKNSHADAKKNYPFFKEGAGKFDKVTMGRFKTTRARFYYIMSYDYNSKDDSMYTVTLPNNLHNQLIVSKFSNKDKKLDREFVVDASSLLKQGRKLSDLYIVDIETKDNYIYALSRNYNLILKIDLTSKKLVDAYAIDSKIDPISITIKDNDFLILERGTNKIYRFSM